ncbi:phosphate ABC transporter permease subunit PstC [Luteolibacter ambystomatis]|uniref:Phosphate transport system permease protein n=1 Tax=Luteolibacter ambystomatis TaxID=2824561 RepID=A0A975J1U0_9BACT|nr:phosphate ABC transporter permease subunit PstC [Luteolibacter ambystomatis]QUE52414.1 phosphate ABC transporter permease subunit PstC [Luteolibacter ambystomatis]
MSEPKPSPVPAGHPFRFKGRSTEGLIKAFFGGNAALTIIILILIIVFLLREGIGFFPKYRQELQVYRHSGLEFVDIARKDLTAQEQMVSLLNRAYYAQINAACRKEMLRSQEATAISNYVGEAITPARDALLRINAPADTEPAPEGEGTGEKAPAKPAPPAELLAKLSAKYQSQLQDALAGKAGEGLPKTPHLTSAEVAGLLEQLRNRDPLSKDDPQFVADLQAAVASKQAEAAGPYVAFRESINAFQDSSSAMDGLVSEISETVKATREAATLNEIETEKRDTLLAAAAKAKDPAARAQLENEATAAVTTPPVDFKSSLEPVMARMPEFKEANAAMSNGLNEVLQKLPQLSDDKAARYLSAFRKAAPELARETADTMPKLQAWNGDEKVGMGSTIWGFVTGRDWITGGGWQDFYGIVPLFAGSLMISLIALALAIPLGVGAAIYTNQLAGPRQQKFVKPTIEFLQAIPSVVLGFVGIAVLGTWLQETSMHDSLSWIPGFPIQQRLNMFTAGCLLGLMAIPTIFTLSEDAINNVPSAFSEASDALGASKLQTIFRVTVPAAISGILAAVLLGLGRVIGETMVVLLVAGNRIQIPDFTEGLGTFFQPAHTLTGIIAQELGEVPFGSVHYRALFVVGILLFLIVLLINWSAQRLLKRFRIGHH